MARWRWCSAGEKPCCFWLDSVGPGCRGKVTEK